MQNGWDARLQSMDLMLRGVGKPLKGLELFMEGPSQICVWGDG